MTCTHRTTRPKNHVYTRSNLDNVINNFFNTAFGEVAPAKRNHFKGNVPTNVLKFNDRFELRLALPGLDKEDIQIDLDKDLLHVSSQGTKESKDRAYRHQEFKRRAFKKTFHLHEHIEGAAIEARFSAGVLIITLPLKEEEVPTPPKTINIH